MTRLVLEYTLFDLALRRLAKEKAFPENDALKIDSRATALKQHLDRIRQDHRYSPQDVVYPPLRSVVPDKPKDWKLELTDKANDEAEKYYEALKTRRKYAHRCFQAKPPMPMGWLPKGGKAWAKTARAKVQSGDLFDSRHWAPIWMDFELASTDVLLGMKVAGLTQDESDEYYDAMRTMTAMKKQFHSRDLRSEDILRG